MRRLLEILGRPASLALCFALCVLATGLGCALRTPISLFPDEPSHIARADGLRYGEILGVNSPVPTTDRVKFGVILNAAIDHVRLSPEFIGGFPDKAEPESAWRQTEAVQWDSHQIYAPTQMVQYFPVFYAPAALGLLLGERLGLTPLHTVYLGRVAMLLAFVAMGMAAVALTRTGAGLLFAVLTLPTLVNLASSYNHDGLMIGACALAVALLTRKQRGAWWAAVGLLVCVGLAKPPYAPLLLVCLAPLLGAGLWRRVLVVGLACMLPAFWLLHTVHSGFVSYPRAPYHPGPLYPGPHDVWLNAVEPGANMRVLLAHPTQIFILPLYTLRAFWGTTWPLILGGISLGNLRIPAWEYPWLVASLGAAALAVMGAARPVPGQNPGWGAVDAGLVVFAVFVSFIAMELSLYLSFTNAGLPYIEGINARYFLLFMPFFVFLLPAIGKGLGRLPGMTRLARLAQGWFVLPAIGMAVTNVYALPAYIIHVFHMPMP